MQFTIELCIGIKKRAVHRSERNKNIICRKGRNSDLFKELRVIALRCVCVHCIFLHISEILNIYFSPIKQGSSVMSNFTK